MKKRNKKGFTIVEVVVSMALLVTVSTLSLTICLEAINKNSNSALIVEANSISLDMVEIYKVADNTDDSDGIFSIISEVYAIDKPENNKDFYIDDIKYNISINDIDKSISIKAYNSSNELLKSIYYEKG